MNVSRVVRLASWNSRKFMIGLRKCQSTNIRVLYYRKASTNLQVVRRFAEQIQNKQGCWKCETVGARTRVVCEKCGVLLTPDMTRNYFDLLGVSETFDVNQSKLTENFRQLQSVVHPDKFSNK